jgi:hypothetical protein
VGDSDVRVMTSWCAYQSRSARWGANGSARWGASRYLLCSGLCHKYTFCTTLSGASLLLGEPTDQRAGADAFAGNGTVAAWVIACNTGVRGRVAVPFSRPRTLDPGRHWDIWGGVIAWLGVTFVYRAYTVPIDLAVSASVCKCDEAA